MNDPDKKSRGLAVLASMLGDDYADALGKAADSDVFGAPIYRMAIDYAFADTWGREGWDRRWRSLVVISVLIALRQPHELKAHIKAGLANKLTVADFEEILVQALPYVGFPCIIAAQTAVIEALREAGLDPDVRTPGEMGFR